MKTDRKRCKVIMLPTEDKSNIGRMIESDVLLYSPESIKYPYQDVTENQHLYIISDDEIKEGDWYFDDLELEYLKPRQAVTSDPDYWEGREDYRKIIATTDSSLGSWQEIVDERNDRRMFISLPQPSKAFIKKYCKVGGIDEVDVEYESFITGQCNCDCHKPGNIIMHFMPCCYPKEVIQPKVDSHNTITIHPIKDSWSRDELQYYLSEFGNYLRDNYYGVGAPKLIPLTKGLSSGTVDEILEKWIKENL